MDQSLISCASLCKGFGSDDCHHTKPDLETNETLCFHHSIYRTCIDKGKG